VALGLAVAVAWAAVGAVLLLRTAAGPAPGEALDPFLAAWSRGDDAAAARETDRPRQAAAELAANRKGLDGARVRVTRLSLREEGEATARARLRVTWEVPGIGRYRYATTALLRKGEERWRIAWRPTVIHPNLDEVTRLGTTRDPAGRGRIVDRRGRAIVTPRAVVRVGVARDQVADPDATARALAEVLDIRPRSYARAIKGAGPKQFVEAVTLRRADHRRLAPRLEGIAGVTTVEDRMPLAPTRTFARALLGTAGPATAEQLERLGPAYTPGDVVGQSGLQAAAEKALKGTPGARVVLRVSGAPTDTLLERRAKRGRTLRTTLDSRVQSAAESALGTRDDEAALVVVQPSSGDILAVANRPRTAAFDRALEGRYPPGSTFKVVSTAALLRDGLRPDDIVPCPATATVGGRAFRNFEGGAAGAVPFAQDFAQSCNTAFVTLSRRLPAGALRRAGGSFGLGEKIDLAVPAAEAQVPPGRDAVERAASMIGQGRILASPLAMAGVAATVADGRWRAPRLLAGDPKRAGRPLGATERGRLRALMRRVVESGTGVALAGLPGAIGGKSGTAEYGGGDPPPTHAWFIAYRGDLALAVLVENGRSGGAVAAPIAARFLGVLGAR
jgi:cell division protein FtsI/penicillin-binding protein 2